MVSIDHQSAMLRPQVGGPPAMATVVAGSSPTVNFSMREITATGAVKLRGTPGEACGGWILGFFQLEFLEVNHARYRGATMADGSVYVSRDRPPSRMHQLCRDSLSTTSLWYAPPGADPSTTVTVIPVGTTIPSTGELQIAATFFDHPREFYPPTETNTAFMPSRVNFLHSVDIGFAFCTVLTAKDPAGGFHFLKHFYWNCRWDVTFNPVGGSVAVAVRKHMDLNLQVLVHSGVPNDSRFNRAHLVSPALPVCNTVANAASPGHRTPSRGW
jgi:hypothetical protein